MKDPFSFRFFKSLLLSSLAILTFAKSESKYVRINIDAKWPQTPLVLEARLAFELFHINFRCSLPSFHNYVELVK